MPRRSTPLIPVLPPRCAFVHSKGRDQPPAPACGAFEKCSIKYSEISLDRENCLDLTPGPSHLNGVFDFRLEFTKADTDNFGLRYQPDKTGLRVLGVQQTGVVGRWNEKQKRLGTAEYSLQFGDLIVRVGDTDEPDAMDDMFHCRSMLQMHIERWPQIVVVELERCDTNESLGVGCKCHTREGGEQVLLICYISGTLQEWNNRALAIGHHFEVVPLGSRIIRVDRGTSVAEMLHGLEHGLNVQVAFERPAAFNVGNGM